MRTLGIDPGLNVTGYGILENSYQGVKLIEAGIIRCDSVQPIPARLREIATEISAIITQFRPDCLAIEELYSHYEHPRTAIIMGHARGVILLKAAELNLPVYPYAATKIKKSLTGNGRASKAQIQKMVQVTLGLSALPEPSDTADAVAIALCHCRSLKQEAAFTR